MLKKSLLIIFLISVINSISFGLEKKVGIGFMFGEPTGLNGKVWLNNTNAIDAGIGWAFIGPDDGFSLHADYLYHIDNTLKSNIRFPLYYGFGLRIRDERGYFGLGFRGVGGIVWYPEPAPVDIFFEIAPVFKLLPETALELDVSVGARYYFN